MIGGAGGKEVKYTLHYDDGDVQEAKPAVEVRLSKKGKKGTQKGGLPISKLIPAPIPIQKPKPALSPLSQNSPRNVRSKGLSLAMPLTLKSPTSVPVPIVSDNKSYHLNQQGALERERDSRQRLESTGSLEDGEMVHDYDYDYADEDGDDIDIDEDVIFAIPSIFPTPDRLLLDSDGVEVIDFPRQNSTSDLVPKMNIDSALSMSLGSFTSLSSFMGQGGGGGEGMLCCMIFFLFSFDF